MFELMLAENRAKTRRGVSVLASFTLQVGVLGAALVVPLLNPELLPRAVAFTTLLAAPPLPQAPTPPRPAEAVPRLKVPLQLVAGERLLAPSRIPVVAADIDDGTLRVAAERGGVVGLDGLQGAVTPQSLGVGTMASGAAPPPPVVSAPPSETKVTRVRVGGHVQDALLVERRTPRYPPLAIQTRVEGKVVFAAVIGSDGRIHSLQLVSGHPMLVAAAREAVLEWRYRPTLLNGDAVEVATTIEVNFTLRR